MKSFGFLPFQIDDPDAGEADSRSAEYLDQVNSLIELGFTQQEHPKHDVRHKVKTLENRDHLYLLIVFHRQISQHNFKASTRDAQ